MPFWQNIQRCEHCRHWVQADPSDAAGRCSWTPPRAPFWQEMPLLLALGNSNVTHRDSGSTCAAYSHQRWRPHPLDRAPSILSRVLVGDLLPMRTYDYGEVTRSTAEVTAHHKHFVAIRMLNANYRMRIRATEFQRPGTVVGLPSWGLDVDRPITKRVEHAEHPERAAAMLAKVRTGDALPLVGYPPFDGMRRRGKVGTVTGSAIRVRVDRKRVAWMHRTGPLAGVMPGEVWTLDTRDAE